MKLPAYARRLIELRHAGHHPLFVRLTFGDEWSEAALRARMEAAALKYVEKGLQPYSPQWCALVGDPLLAIAPRDFKPGSHDLRCVAGAAVFLEAQKGQGDEWESPLYYLGGELSRWAAVVEIHALGGREMMGQVARAARAQISKDSGAAPRWPAWWSDELDKEHGAKFERWNEAAKQFIASHSARAAA